MTDTERLDWLQKHCQEQYRKRGYDFQSIAISFHSLLPIREQIDKMKAGEQIERKCIVSGCKDDPWKETAFCKMHHDRLMHVFEK